MKRLDEKCSNEVPKVFRRKNEINDMPLGSEDFPQYKGGTEGGIREDDHLTILLGITHDPGWGKLQLRGGKWKESVVEW